MHCYFIFFLSLEGANIFWGFQNIGIKHSWIFILEFKIFVRFSIKDIKLKLHVRVTSLLI